MFCCCVKSSSSNCPAWFMLWLQVKMNCCLLKPTADLCDPESLMIRLQHKIQEWLSCHLDFFITGLKVASSDGRWCDSSADELQQLRCVTENHCGRCADVYLNSPNGAFFLLSFVLYEAFVKLVCILRPDDAWGSRKWNCQRLCEIIR